MTAQQPRQPVEKVVHHGLRLDHDGSRGRFSLWHGSTFVGFLGYYREGDVVTLQHTIVNEEFGRRGYARALVTLVLDRFKNEGLKIIPECSYVQDYLRRYPEYNSMVVKKS
ncbi:GNAT family N-acetyltransferase [Glutamicibacter sp. FBE19]|uniref:GNAT family N-acetyltransferase n=1 Tax=Glutamicibacter sp. FBE19 TaxID=2761534 RepID=UPI0018965F06|nr:GNAT family N-acetyltransferase [Glutamicibacter sp. FBE19]MBF6673249.1 N-acetyltransferase [Glutamicibacter sp. FBE19]